MEVYLKKAGVWNAKKTLCRTSIFALPVALLPALPDAETAAPAPPPAAPSPAAGDAQAAPPSAPLGARGLTCLACGLVFSSPALQHAHFREEAHLQRLRSKSRAREAAEQGQEDGASSDSSDGEDDDEENNEDDADDDATETLSSAARGAATPSSSSTAQGTVLVRPYDGRQGVTVSFRPSTGPSAAYSFTLSNIPLVLPTSPTAASSPGSASWQSLHRCLHAAQANSLWAVLLLRSGKFSGLIVDGKGTRVLLTKVFKRYTVRAKAGGSQSSHDNKGGAAHSAGAAMRRAGELALQEEVTGLMRAWGQTLAQCACVLVSAPKVMRSLLFDPSDKDTGLLKKDDPRIVSVPFMVPKITHSDALAVFTKCTTVFVSRDAGSSGSPASSSSAAAGGGGTASSGSSSGSSISSAEADVDGASLTMASEIQDEYTAIVSALRQARREARGGRRARERERKEASEAGGLGEGAAWTADDCLVGHMCGLLRLGRASDVEALLEKMLRRSGKQQKQQGVEEEDDEEEEEEDGEGGGAVGAKAALALMGWRLEEVSPALLVALVERRVSEAPSTKEGTKEGKEGKEGESYGTLLHVAAEVGAGGACRLLLLLGADPCSIDSRGRLPYLLCRDKETRDCFRRARSVLEGPEAVGAPARGGGSGWDWDAAGVGPALSEDLEAQQQQQARDKEREKKKRAKARKSEAKKKADAAAAALQQQQLEQQQQAAAEAQARREAMGACGMCQRSLCEPGVTLVEVFGGRLCSAACAMGFRRKVQAEAAEKRFGKK